MLEQKSRSVGDVLTDMSHTIERLMRAEVSLASAGATERVSAMLLRGAVVVAALLLAVLSVGLLMAGAVMRLSQMMQPWEASLVVAATTGLLSLAVAIVGLRSLTHRPAASRIAEVN